MKTVVNDKTFTHQFTKGDRFKRVDGGFCGGGSCSIGEGVAVLAMLSLIVYLPFALATAYAIFKRLNTGETT